MGCFNVSSNKEMYFPRVRETVQLQAWGIKPGTLNLGHKAAKVPGGASYVLPGSWELCIALLHSHYQHVTLD